jgi:hypothetical protein
MLLLIALQAAAVATAPDIQIGARVRARSVTITKRGDAELTVTTNPEGANLVDVRAPDANGRKTIRNVDVTVDAQARIADPQITANIEANSEPGLAIPLPE